jgi:hypothetical protein
MATVPPEIPTIATEQQRTRQQQQWRTVFLGVGVIHAYYLLAPWLPPVLRLPVAWFVCMPPLLPCVVVAMAGRWWQSWRVRPVPDPFEPIPQSEDHPS